MIVENHISITEKAAVEDYEKILGSVYPNDAEIIAAATCVSSDDKGLFLHWLRVNHQKEIKVSVRKGGNNVRSSYFPNQAGS